MTPEEQAKLLAEWLEANPGSPAPEGMDSEVVEALYVLRPDLAPAPQIQLESILERIEEGPYAVPDSPKKSESHPRMAIWRGLGGLAAAAAVLLIALPQQDELRDLGPQLAAPTPSETTFEAPNSSSTRGLRSSGLEEAESPEALGELQPSLERANEAPKPPMTATEDPSASPSPEPLADAPRMEEERTMDFLESNLSSPEEMIGTGALGETDGYGGLSGTRSSRSTQVMADPGEDSEPSMDAGEGAGGAPVPLQAPQRSAVSAPPQAEERKRSFPFLGRSRRSAESPQAAPAPTDQEGALADSPIAEDILTVLRTAAYPQDYGRPNPKLSDNPTASEAQWIAADQALELLEQSKSSEALSKAESALPLSTANTPALSMLYWVVGEVHLSLGDRNSAQVAYKRAADLNAAR